MPKSDNLVGALFMMASMAAFTLNDASMKLLAGDVPLFQLLFLRGIVTTLLAGGAAWALGALKWRLPASDLRLIAWRIVAEIGAAYFFLTALFNMPIANVTAILQSLPLTITLTAALVLKEPVGWRRLAAILVGFVGVILIVRPGAEGFSVYSIYVLIAVGFVTLRDLTTRRLSPAVPSLLVTLTTTVSVTVFFGLASLGQEWVEMTARSFGLTIGAGVLVIGGYLFSVLVMRRGEISFTANFRYTSLIWALVLGWFVFKEWPDAITLLGAAIVVGSGLYMLYREARISAKTRRAHALRPN